MRDDDLNGKNGVGTSSSSPPASFAEEAERILARFKHEEEPYIHSYTVAVAALTALHVADCERIIPEKQYNLGLPGMYRAAYNKAIDEMRQRLEAQK